MAAQQLPDTRFPVTWKQGQHVAVVGRTGSGKTYLISELVKLRKYVVILRTKPDSNTFPGFTKVRKASAMGKFGAERLLLEPEYSRQAIEGFNMLETAWQEGGWTVVIDENWYAEAHLGLKPYIVRLLTQGRSKDISVVIGMQRPVDISRFALSEVTHLFVFRTEGRDLKFSLRDSTNDAIVPAVRSLRGHDFVYYNAAKDELVAGNANRLHNVLVSTLHAKGVDGVTANRQAAR